MAGARQLGAIIAEALGSNAIAIGAPQTVRTGGWQQQLELARPTLEHLARTLGTVLSEGRVPVIVAGRCAASIATLPQISARHPDAALVWLDAHGDCNVPRSGNGGVDAYLGGMVISAATGEWNSGFGGSLSWDNVILVGSRDLDPPEWERIHSGQINHVEIGPELGKRLRAAIGDRPVYVHLDCDVLDAGLLATEYQVSGGLDWSDLYEAFHALAECDVVGLEVAEYEATWPDGRPNSPDRLVEAIAPLLKVLA